MIFALCHVRASNRRKFRDCSDSLQMRDLPTVVGSRAGWSTGPACGITVGVTDYRGLRWDYGGDYGDSLPIHYLPDPPYGSNAGWSAAQRPMRELSKLVLTKSESSFTIFTIAGVASRWRRASAGQRGEWMVGAWFVQPERRVRREREFLFESVVTH